MTNKRKTITQMRKEILKLEKEGGVEIYCSSCGRPYNPSSTCSICGYGLKIQVKPDIKIKKLFTNT